MNYRKGLRRHGTQQENRSWAARVHWQPGTFPAAIESSASKARFLLQALAHGDWLTITETSFEPHETNNNANPQRISHRDEAADRMSPGVSTTCRVGLRAESMARLRVLDQCYVNALARKLAAMPLGRRQMHWPPAVTATAMFACCAAVRAATGVVSSRQVVLPVASGGASPRPLRHADRGCHRRLVVAQQGFNSLTCDRCSGVRSARE